MVDQSAGFDNDEVAQLRAANAILEAGLQQVRENLLILSRDSIAEAVAHLDDLREARGEAHREALEVCAKLCDAAARAPTDNDAVYLAAAIRASGAR